MRTPASARRPWLIAYYALLIAFIGTAILNMLQIRAGFFTNHAADVVVPAWMYVVARGLHSSRGRTSFFQRTIGRTPEIAAAGLFIASTLTELSQRYWPHGIFPGRFDVMDVLSYACGLAACYAADRLSPRPSEQA